MPKLHTDAPYYNWDEITKEVEANTGKEVRDWAGKWKGAKPGADNIPYQDFWHKVIEMYDIHNGAVTTMNFQEIAEYYKGEPWIVEICNEYIKVLGPSDDDGDYRIKHEW